MKSIVTCKTKTTAEKLGVKEGDKFVVLSVKDSFGDLYEPPLPEGTIVVLIKDNGTSLPRFKIMGRKGRRSKLYLGFTYLARYEEQKEEKIVLDKVKFDMKAIAADLGVNMKEAHSVVQCMLFEKGLKWPDGRASGFCGGGWDALWLYVDDGVITYSDCEDVEPSFPTYGVKIEKSFYKTEEPKIIALNGKKYKLID